MIAWKIWFFYKLTENVIPLEPIKHQPSRCRSHVFQNWPSFFASNFRHRRKKDTFSSLDTALLMRNCSNVYKSFVPVVKFEACSPIVLSRPWVSNKCKGNILVQDNGHENHCHVQMNVMKSFTDSVVRLQ